jgi:hypothetical protein
LFILGVYDKKRSRREKERAQEQLTCLFFSLLAGVTTNVVLNYSQKLNFL